MFSQVYRTIPIFLAEVHKKSYWLNMFFYSSNNKQFTVYTWTQYCILGWMDFGLFYIFHKSTPEICYIPSKSTENSNKKKSF
jgi:hypothetical protein